ncbi:hypothetical protein ABB37_06310 [Leptomonas pyrrhocoris]|uniref:Globin family profile domain-containing protein n=1 Tax=Leptomonas pyrrhocoris TaxID=157538 RepID=A0A0M9FXW3_LEPPY|nr:hypothetical protein ABB37_06310 [Leptomonas pyrrhocoris]KPA78126.1 hypothetical protein ABB37_06310 [Leptomonas pyrrhocoris]|eukprot:XP_015656565.1 hypothetical protein ABB37_06310 [Leptomonas pyrrhocoris]
MVGGKQRHVLFFGSLAVSVAGHDVYDDEVVAQLERQSAFVKLRTTVSAPFRKTEESFAAVATSPLYEIHQNDAPLATAAAMVGAFGAPQPSQPHRFYHSSQHQHHRQRAAFVPVMLELAKGVAAEEVPSIEEMDRDLTSLPSPSDDGLSALNSGDVTAENYASASVRIEVDLSRSGNRTGLVAMQEVSLPSLNYLARHHVCTLVRIPLLTSTIQKAAVSDVDAASLALEEAQRQCSSGSLDGAADLGAAGVALHLYVVVRVVSLAEKVRLTQEADDAVRPLLDAAESEPAALRLRLTQRGEAPYGAMPLTELYRHYKRFFEHDGNTVLKHGDAIMRRLGNAPRQREADASFPHRWNALTEVDLRPLLLGEKAFAPLLLTLAHCTNLRALYADGNQLGDLTCGRLAVLFRRHRYLAYIGLAKNGIHEGGAAQLMRLLKHNLRITALPCEGNYFSDAMQQRIAQATAKNANVIANDPLNIFSQDYSYLTDLSSLPEPTQRQALRTWAMLSAAPVGDVDVMVHNSTTSSQRTIGDSPQIAMQRAKMALHARETFSLIPPAALAPLLNEVMRTVYVAVSRLLPDPLVRSLFSDMEMVLARQQEQKEAQADGAATQRGRGDAGGSSLPHGVRAALGDERAAPINPEKLYARSFARVVVTVFRGLMLSTPWEEMAVVLEGIGRMHRDLGVMAEDYWLAVHVFMAAVRISCGSDSYDADHASSFLAILALAVRTTAGFAVQLK